MNAAPELPGRLAGRRLVVLVFSHFREYDLQVLEAVSCLAAVRQTPPLMNHDNTLIIRQWKFHPFIQSPVSFLSYNQFHTRLAVSWLYRAPLRAAG